MSTRQAVDWASLKFIHSVKEHLTLAQMRRRPYHVTDYVCNVYKSFKTLRGAILWLRRSPMMTQLYVWYCDGESEYQILSGQELQYMDGPASRVAAEYGH